MRHLSFIIGIFLLFAIFGFFEKKDNNQNEKNTNNLTILKPTIMDEKCQLKYSGTKYNKYNDKCECPENQPFDERINSCPTPYESVIGRGLSLEYCDESGFALPINAHCTPFNENKSWECDQGFYQSYGEGQFSGQIVCVNRKNNYYFGHTTCDKQVFKFGKNEIVDYNCKPNSERALKDNYEKVNTY